MVEQSSNHRTHSGRARPAWACRIHDLGDDLRWALGAWCDFPRPVRRITAAAITAAGAQLTGADDAIVSLLTTLTE